MRIRTLFVLSLVPLLAACSAVAPVPDSSHVLAESARLRDLLKIRVADLAIDNQPLEKAVGALAERYRLNIDWRWRALGKAGIGRNTPVTVHLHEVTLDTALAAICAAASDPTGVAPMGFVPFGGVLVFSTREDLRTDPPPTLVRRSFDVRDLVTDYNLTGPVNADRRMADLISVIVHQVGPGTWSSIRYPDARLVEGKPEPFDDFTNGGLPPADEAAIGVYIPEATGDAAISVFNSSIIVTQTPDHLAEVAALLEMLRKK